VLGRDGGRHSDSQDVVSLRGRTEKCESWPVRLVCMGLVPRQASAPATTGVLWKNEEGNVVGVRKAHALLEADAQHASSRARTRPSLNPGTRARQCHRFLPKRRKPPGRRRWRVGLGIAAGQTHASGRNRQRDLGRRNSARLAARHRSSVALAQLGRSCVTRKKRKVVMATVPARKRESRAQCPCVVFQLQKSAGSILAPNKLARSTPKRVAVRVNGGLAKHVIDARAPANL